MPSLMIDIDMQDPSQTTGSAIREVATYDCKQTTGPGKTILGYFPYSLSFGPSCKMQVTVAKDQFINKTGFCIRMAFRVTGTVTSRQNLAEAGMLPFSLFIEPCSNNAAEFQLTAGLLTEPYGWMETSTFCRGALQKGKWYVADFAFDKDTMALFIDGAMVGLTVIPMATITRNSETDHLYIGAAINGMDYRLEGEIATFQWYNGIPSMLASQIATCRNLPEWHISEKQISMLKIHDFGAKTMPLQDDPYYGTITQEYEKGVIIFIKKNSHTIELYGPLWPHYQTYLSTLVALNIQKSKVVKTVIKLDKNNEKPPKNNGLFSGLFHYSNIREHHPSLHHMMQLFVKNMRLPV